jgi:GntR family transcriptional regulator
MNTNTKDMTNVPRASTPVVALLTQLHLEDHVAEPHYLQLHRQIEVLVRSGALPAGASMPSERALADLLKISRATVKHCYDRLCSAGLLHNQGRRNGMVVQGVPQRVSPALRVLKGFTEEMQELGRKPSTRVLERAVVSDRAVAPMFNRSSEIQFLRLVRLRLADDMPMSHEVAWYDLGLAPELANWPGNSSAYQFLREHCGLHLTWARQSIEAVTSSTQEAEFFGFTQPNPCLLLKRMSYTADNQQVEYVEGTFRGDIYRYQVERRI